MPLKVGRLSTPFRVRCIVAVMAVVCIALTLFPLWTLNVEPYNGGPLACLYRWERVDEYDTWLMVVRRFGTLLLPTTLLVIFSSLIMYFLARAHHARPQVQIPICTGIRFYAHSLAAISIPFPVPEPHQVHCNYHKIPMGKIGNGIPIRNTDL